MRFTVFIFNNRRENSPSFLLLISWCRFSRSLSSSDLLSSVAQGLPAAAGLRRGRGTRGRCRHTLWSASLHLLESKARGAAEQLESSWKKSVLLLCHPLPSVLIPSLWILLIKFLYPRPCGSSPHSSLPVIITFCPSVFKWSEPCFQLLINSILLRSLPSLVQSLLFALAFPCSYPLFIHLSLLPVLPLPRGWAK